MPRRKATKASLPSSRLTQTTLPGLFGSPVSSSPTKSVSGPKSPYSSKRTNTRARLASPDSEHGRSDDDDEISDVGAIRFEKKRIDTSSEDEQPRLSPMKKRRTRVSSFDGLKPSIPADSTNAGSNDEAVSQVHWKGKGKGKGKQNVVVDSDGSNQSNKRRLVRGVRPPSPEDEDGIMDELDENDILDNRMRRRDRKTAFQKNLEKLKRKKQGKAISDSSQSEDEYESSIPPFDGARPDADSDAAEGSDEEAVPTTEGDSFIVEDDNAVIPDLPAMFSMNTHQDLAHHFKIVCQLFVHLAVSPVNKRRKMLEGFLRDNEYFSLPLQIARRKLFGLRDSLVTSSIWRPQFKKMLETYPKLRITQLDFAVPVCDACHLGGRTSTRIGRLSGSPYNKMGFKPLKHCNLSDNEGSNGEQPSMEFHLGRFCAKRTKVFHQFTHWEYDLFASLCREVEELQKSNGKHGFVRVAFVDGTQPPEDFENADEIMDWLDERKIIEMEWVKVKDMMESAHHLDLAVKKGEED